FATNPAQWKIKVTPKDAPNNGFTTNAFIVAPACSTSASWTQLSPTGTPPDPNSQTFVSDGQGNLIMFGGCGPTGCHTSTVASVLRGAFGLPGAPSWLQLATTGVAPQSRPAHP